MAEPKAFDPASPFPPGGPSHMMTAVLPPVRGQSQQMAVTIRVPGATLTVLLDKQYGEQWAASIAETAGMLAEPVPPAGPANGRLHTHG